MPSYQKNTVQARETITIQILAVRVHSGASDGDWFEGLHYKTLIKCLAKHESDFNPKAVGDNGKAIGLLQFWRETWDRYCEGDIWDPYLQAQCADKMLIDDWNNIKHWTTREYCI